MPEHTSEELLAEIWSMPAPCSLLGDLRIGFGGGRARLLRFFSVGFLVATIRR